MKALNVAIAGFGKAAEIYHSPFINNTPGLKIVKVLERHKTRSRELFPWVKVVKNFPDLLNDPSVDIVVITTPNDCHFSMAKEALKANKHVVVDKPFTCLVEEADELIELAEQKKRVLTVYHNRRLDGPLLAVKRALKQNLVGKPEMLEIRFDRFRPELKPESWRESEREGAGLLFDIGAHLIDYALALFGTPDRIDAKIESQRKNSKTDDFFDIHLKYSKSDIKVKLTAGMLVSEKAPHFVLSGSEGRFVIEDLDPQEEALKNGLLPGSENWPKDIDVRHYQDGKLHLLTFSAGDYTDFYRNLVAAVTNNSELLIKPEEAREVIRVIEESRKINSERLKK